MTSIPLQIQNPKQHIAIRSMIGAPKGFSLIQLDLSGAEAWVVAYLADDPNMKYELHNGDMHSRTACSIFNIAFNPDDPKEIRYKNVDKKQRYGGKKTNHSSNYMQGDGGLVEAINAEGVISITYKDAKMFKEAWRSLYYMVPSWWEETRHELTQSRTLTTAYGYSYTFMQAWSDDLIRAAVAFRPQSTVAVHCYGKEQKDVNKKGGLLEIHRHFKKDKEINIIQTAHDSCVLLAPSNVSLEVAAIARSYMLRPLMIKGEIFTIPVDVEIGEYFGELEKVKL